ncbi:MAG TPA: VOC family protein [Humisphaera sp.]
MAKPIPDGYTAVTPYLILKDVAAELDFVVRAFGATVHTKMTGPDGSIGHCDVSLHGAHVMMGQAHGPHDPTPTMLYLYVADADAVHAAALAAGAALDMPVTDQFYGDRAGSVKDANGVTWWIATHKEDLSEAQLAERMRAMPKK